MADWTRFLLVCCLVFPAQCFVLPVQESSRCVSKSHPLKMGKKDQNEDVRLKVGRQVGKGSYGTVHLCTLDRHDSSSHPPLSLVCKRPWTTAECAEQKHANPAQRQERCQYYFNVEKHCMEKIRSSKRPTPFITDYLGSYMDDKDGLEWMVFSMISQPSEDTTPAPSLADIMGLDQDDKENNRQEGHHLQHVQEALGLGSNAALADTLDTVLSSLLRGLDAIHGMKIVHRDMKPGNLLCDAKQKSLVLIDFGSAADMEPTKRRRLGFGGKIRVGLEEGNAVAVSPIYAAPEVFIKQDSTAFAFDVFSAALVFCQLLFNCLDERTDAGLHQQLEDAGWDLDAWLSRTLSSKVRPNGLEDALYYLADRKGLWGLLGRMLKRDPFLRISSRDALATWDAISEGENPKKIKVEDGPYFDSVIRLIDSCEVLNEIPYYQSSLDETKPEEPRPLHFVASFRRGMPLGLLLGEVGGSNAEEELEGEELQKWKAAAGASRGGDVLIQRVIKGSQAEALGVFEIGDALQGVGDLPLTRPGGLETVLDMLNKQPRSNKHIKLHFARKMSAQFERPKRRGLFSKGNKERDVRVIDQGAYALKGRRSTQEDAFVLHGIAKDVIVAGVFDGHGGTAASKMASRAMPGLVADNWKSNQNTPRQALELAWAETCRSYRNSCEAEEDEDCMAEYDPVEGIIQARTGSAEVVAGTTASLAMVSGEDITVLNCGDSRTLYVTNKSGLQFVTTDHDPEHEMDRLLKGADEGKDYSIPECSLSSWYVPVGDIGYAVCRSLEGSLATSKGIISDPDVTSMRADPGLLVMATDGVFEVMDNAYVSKQVRRMKRFGMSASEAAKTLCCMAFDRGSADNISVVVIYLGF
eukprot:CAMPEP_0116832662 /NCGR_PEP_ID=MMETSP0418-20121206/6014_1 /TAXON_ID=1158023 /ORGANISM="Astrosyne radiata, Strain 13vi08-1A" /LENGTH=864 /DNA_ID=CAMNT_0004462043 /DNA_START=501 /DNA_END=3095 /DNA_ORIENTATION=-